MLISFYFEQELFVQKRASDVSEEEVPILQAHTVAAPEVLLHLLLARAHRIKGYHAPTGLFRMKYHVVPRQCDQMEIM